MRKILINSYKKNLEVGDYVMVHAYKYNGWLYRIWSKALVVDINDEWIVLSTYNSLVLSSEEQGSRAFKSVVNKITFWFLFPNRWFNIIASVGKHGIKLYINVASPFIYEDGAIKYYDFDVDFKLHASKVHTELDINEFMENSVKYQYPNELIEVIEHVRDDIKYKFSRNWFERFTDFNTITKLYQKQFKLINEQKNSKDKKS